MPNTNLARDGWLEEFYSEQPSQLVNNMQFQKAVRKKAKLRLALTGPSGSGKTWGALQIAKGLGEKIAVIDTEHGSASLYSDLCEFDCLELTPPYSPERYIEAIHAAEKAGYDILIVDSTTHEWSGSGGCLEINENTAKARFRGNTWSAWNDTTPRHRAFIDAMLQSSMHVIATGRSKTETAQTEENGKKRVVKLGMKTEQRDGFEYEFTAVLDLVHDGHYATASKDRTGLFGNDPKPITSATGEALREWLESGAEQVPEKPRQEEISPRRAELDELSLYLIELCEDGKEIEAATLFYAKDTFQYDDEKLIVWNNLKPNTAVRSAIKRGKPQWLIDEENAAKVGGLPFPTSDKPEFEGAHG